MDMTAGGSAVDTPISPTIFDGMDVDVRPSPFPREWVLDGSPRAFNRLISRSADLTTSVVVWTCTPGRFEWHYQSDEIAHFLSGEVFITDDRGEERRVGAGDTIVFSAGTRYVWRITQDVRKVAVCRVPVPTPVGFCLRVWGYLCRIARHPGSTTLPTVLCAGNSVRHLP